MLAVAGGAADRLLRAAGRTAIPGPAAAASWAALLPDLLRPAGYRSYHSGKWHVDGPAARRAASTARTWSSIRTGTSRPATTSSTISRCPSRSPRTAITRPSRSRSTPSTGSPSTTAEHRGDPFFLYLAFTVPHFPVHGAGRGHRPLPRQVPGRLGCRSGGRRLERMRKLGDRELRSSPPRTPGVPAWDTLTAEEKDAWQRRMAIHAAMVDRMDREIGRVLDQVRKSGQWENTLIFFASDNGASAEQLVRGDGHDPAAPPGSAQSYLCIEPPWANLANAPFRKSKIFTHEGGIATPVDRPLARRHHARAASCGTRPATWWTSCRHSSSSPARPRPTSFERRTATAAVRPQPRPRVRQRRTDRTRRALVESPGQPRLPSGRLEDRRLGPRRRPGSSTTSPPTAAKATTWPRHSPNACGRWPPLGRARHRVPEARRHGRRSAPEEKAKAQGRESGEGEGGIEAEVCVHRRRFPVFERESP